ncbi:MAG: hypothetical protein ACLSBH_12635 [Coprobacillus cateniformis]
MKILFSQYAVKESLLIIKNTNHPEDAGTLIVESYCHKPDHVITGIAGNKRFCNYHD